MNKTIEHHENWKDFTCIYIYKNDIGVTNAIGILSGYYPITR
jgi:hypothetical protein